jgi:hypothetical protein
MLLYTSHISISIYNDFDFNSYVVDLHFIMVDCLHIVPSSTGVVLVCIVCMLPVVYCLFRIIEDIFIEFHP